MSHGVKKSTYVEADGKTTKALTFDLLDNLYTKVDQAVTTSKEQVKANDVRFRKLENRKKRDAAVASASGMFGGFIAVILYYIKYWLSK